MLAQVRQMLARRTAGTRVTVLSFHPGFVRSNLGVDGPWWWRALGPLLHAFAQTMIDWRPA